MKYNVPDHKIREQIAVAKAFNKCINSKDQKGLTDRMDKDHQFIDHDGVVNDPPT